MTARHADSATPRDHVSTSPRVVHLDHTASEGGAEFSLARMLRAGAAWRHVLLVPPHSGSVFRGIPVVTNGVRQPAGVSSGRLGVVVAATSRLFAQAAATRIHPGFRSADIVDANTARSAAYGAIAARTSRVAFVVHLQDVVDAEALGGFGFSVMTKLVLPRADGVIACSRTALASAAAHLREDTATEVIPSASGLEPGVERAPRDGGGALRIGMLARIDPWKGQHLLLEAFAEALGATDAILEFAGAPLFGHEGYLEDLRRRAAELRLSERVRFLGQVKDVPGLLDTWDVAVQYSTRPEPLGQNVLQYLAAGCAVVVADEGGPAEWIEQSVNGVRVAPRDIGALAATLRTLDADGTLRGDLARAAVVTPGLMDDAAVMRAHARFYRDLLEQLPARRRRSRRAGRGDVSPP